MDAENANFDDMINAAGTEYLRLKEVIFCVILVFAGSSYFLVSDRRSSSEMKIGFALSPYDDVNIPDEVDGAAWSYTAARTGHLFGNKNDCEDESVGGIEIDVSGDPFMLAGAHVKHTVSSTKRNKSHIRMTSNMRSAQVVARNIDIPIRSSQPLKTIFTCLYRRTRALMEIK